ncbi:hypothetical protein TVAG_350740 [Trichomonas vaginalis G3]|uniref:Uncharacterized protein n=1 Tax=Trichomonas vaginalis (strain ATCC PRA-98 / G3) TaxID=412133 RepID=A2GQ58_TRIV3|nr:hypothetical protein TVAGG3_0487760 [Trichomonas vaginalis G3]EAX80710.1 hypothetical protein TVAG_350740 [Trichomonas vaginalis G3]KAI5516157.1 hypothetical protein TVAGG3_0487760 [Trichomonas vaginalis G3]|eukprot:XP_001293640.1 hypothetical protein [Trichomonas vaginalis G3]
MALQDFVKHFDRFYLCLRTDNRYHYTMRTSFKAGSKYKVNDGSEYLTQWKLTFSKPTNMYILYEKNAVEGLHQLVMKKSKEKVSHLYQGDKCFHDAPFRNMEVSSWIYNVTDIDEPWWVVPYVVDGPVDCDVCIQIWTDNEIGYEEVL